MPSQTTAMFVPKRKVIPVNKLNRNAEKKNRPAALENGKKIKWSSQ